MRSGDAGVLRDYVQQFMPSATEEEKAALARIVKFVNESLSDRKREAATLDGIDDLVKTTDEAVAAVDTADEAIGLATVGVMGAVAHVATNLAAAADRLASIDESLRTIAEAHTPQRRAEDAAAEVSERRAWERADIVIDPSGIIRKNKYGDTGGTVGDISWAIISEGRCVNVYLSRGDKP